MFHPARNAGRTERSEPPLSPTRNVASLALLSAALGLAYADRVAFSVATEAIERALHLSDQAMGALGGIAFALLNAVATIPLALLADRGRRRAVIVGAVAVWSGATVLTGRAHGFASLAASRVATGIGEAGISPAALSFLAGAFPASRRATVLAILYTGGYAGLVLGFAGGGALVDAIGWRGMFAVFGAAGLPIAALLARVLPREAHPEPEPGLRLKDGVSGALAGLASLLGDPVLRALLLYAASAGLVAWGALQWDVVFYMRRFGMSAGEAGFWFGIAFGAGTAIGTALGGPAADVLARRDGETGSAGLRFALAAYLVGQPFQILAYATPNEALSLAAMVVTVVTGAVTVGPVQAALQSAAPPRSRAAAASLYLLAGSLVGAALGPWAFGAISDALTPRFGSDALRAALILCGVLGFWPAYHLWRVAVLRAMPHRRAMRG